MERISFWLYPEMLRFMVECTENTTQMKLQKDGSQDRKIDSDGLDM